MSEDKEIGKPEDEVNELKEIGKRFVENFQLYVNILVFMKDKNRLHFLLSVFDCILKANVIELLEKNKIDVAALLRNHVHRV